MQPSRGRRLIGGLSRVLVALIALGVLGLAYQAAATAIDARRFPPPGKMVDVGGYQLHIRCYGEGSPTLLFEAGAGGSSLDWAALEPEVKGLSRTCLYDRAGLGWSQPGPTPRTVEQGAHELHTLMERAGEKGPFVLVAHSLGGLQAQVYAGLYPEQVAGLVLVDPTAVDPVGPDLRRGLNPEQVAALEQMAEQGYTAMERVNRALTWLSRFGLIRAAGLLGASVDPVSAQAVKVPEAVRPAFRALNRRTRSPETATLEAAATRVSLEQGSRVTSLGNLPIIVLRPVQEEVAGTPLPPGFTPELMSRIKQIKTVDLILSLSPQARLVEVPGSGHYIQLDQPRAVAEAVRSVFDQVRSR